LVIYTEKKHQRRLCTILERKIKKYNYNLSELYFDKMKFLRYLLGITKFDKEKNQCFREKTGAQNIVEEIKQYQQK